MRGALLRALAVGAALNLYAEQNGGLTPTLLQSLYLGPDISREEAVQALDAAGLTTGTRDRRKRDKIKRGTIRGTKRRPTGGLVEHGERFDVQECAV
jgi:hypothetical protein